MSLRAPVAFVLPNMRGGGAERVALTVIEALANRGFAVDLVLQKAEGELLALLPPGVRVIDLDAPRLRAVIGPLVRYLRSEQPRAVHASMWPLTVVVIIAHRRARSPAILSVSEHSTLSSQYAGLGPAHRAFLRGSLRWFYPRAHARVAVSRGVAEDLSRLSGLARSRFEVIHNPIPPVRDAPVDDRLVQRLWGRGAGARVLTVGSLIAVKNHALLIDAFERLRARREARLAIVGNGPLAEQTRSLALASPAAAAISVPGFLSDPSPAYASADLFVLSSDYEGFGNVLVEAMQHGLPVVSTDCPNGPSEVLDGGRYGTLVPRGDPDALAAAMEEALSRPVDAERQRARAREISGEGAIAAYLRVLGLPSAGGDALA